MRNILFRQSLVLFLLLVSAGTGVVSAQSKDASRGRELSVMTRNMYLGTDFGEIFAAQTPEELVAEVAEAYTEVGASIPAERIAGIADEIEAASPIVVGLQEVALWRVGAPFDPSPSEIVTYDFLQLLLDELNSRGLHYAPISVQTNFDAEVPAVFSPTLAFDVRFTDRLVVLARTDLQKSQFMIEDVQAQHFTTNLTFTSPTLGTLTIPRAWISADVKMRGKTFRYVNSHLESFSPIINFIQASELVQTAGNTDLPLILAGDFNSDAESGGASYQLFLDAGLNDVWEQTHGNDAGLTWALFLTDASAYTIPTQRLDLVMIRGAVDAFDADVIGEDPTTDRTPSGLMRSDHAGVIASLILRP
ncbi:MAG: endonuclease/exonuclease/phosphatase family protein [Pyrinomonadaceae bacterium]